MRASILVLSVTALALSACAKRDPVADNLNQSGNVVAAVNAANATAAAAANNAAAETAPGTTGPAEIGAIPPALRGRWGMTPADCTSTKGDNKGLLVITGDQLQFYESRAVPAAQVQASANSLSGDFAFTGEGQQWTRFETLQLQDGKLVRTESDPMASYTYARCE